MTERRRKASKLTGSPLAPPVANEVHTEPTASTEDPTTPQATVRPPVASVDPKKATQAAPKAPKKKKVSFYLAPEEETRAKAAWQFTMGFTNHRTWTSFFEEAVRRYTRELEAEYNDSKPFGRSTE